MTYTKLGNIIQRLCQKNNFLKKKNNCFNLNCLSILFIYPVFDWLYSNCIELILGIEYRYTTATFGTLLNGDRF